MSIEPIDPGVYYGTNHILKLYGEKINELIKEVEALKLYLTYKGDNNAN